ncbi:MAG: hypothetical protein AAFQ22_04245 [Pseudomonadota bacterium]
MNLSKLKMLGAVVFASIMLEAFYASATPDRQNRSNETGSQPTPVLALCPADAAWISDPTLPAEVGGDSFCDFYQFSWKAFYYLMSPSAADPSIRNFEDTSRFPVLLDQDSCEPTSPGKHTVYVRTTKQNDNTPDFTLPQAINQAGAGSTIYDQNGHVVYYSMSFSRDLCTKAASATPQQGNLPENAIELKFAWRVLNPVEVSEFVTIDATIFEPGAANPSTYKLGLVGFHMALSTPNHPEMVWASFEHHRNAPNCTLPDNPTATAWSFTSPSCAACLATPTDTCVRDTCAFNTAPNNATAITGKPTEICRLYPTGTAPEDHMAETNINVINTLNAQLTGTDGLVAKSVVEASPKAVLANYRMLGAQWLKDPSIGSNPTLGQASNQRGSLVLENPVMETTFQGEMPFVEHGVLAAVMGNQSGATNCFTCHEYTPGNTATVTESSNRNGLSHIYGEIINQIKLTEDEN